MGVAGDGVRGREDSSVVTLGMRSFWPTLTWLGSVI